MVYGLYRALHAERVFLPPSPAKVAFRELDASVGASGPHDFAVRFSAVRYRHIHVHRIPPRGRDDRETPLRVGRDSESYSLISISEKQKYFCQRGWTGHNSKASRGEVICPSGSQTHVIASASEAIHGATSRKLDCFVASAFARRRASADRSAPRNDGETHRSSFRGDAK